MNNHLLKIFKDEELKAKIQKKLPYLFGVKGDMKDDC